MILSLFIITLFNYSGAFYTIKLFDKLRLISMNTNYCVNLNFWLLINSTDPLDQLKWLAEILQESEDNKEKVKNSPSI